MGTLEVGIPHKIKKCGLVGGSIALEAALRFQTTPVISTELTLPASCLWL